MAILRDFISLFFPRCCLACSESLVRGEEILCTNCLLELPRTNYHLQKGNPIEEKLFGRIPVKHAWAFLKFKKRGTVQHLLHQLKYNNHPEVGIALGKVFGKALADSGFDQSFELIVPVPLHWSRLRKRGYNQSSKFAEGLSSSLKIPWDESITIRRERTATQTKKSRMQRWENVKDVFTISQNDKILGKRILLVDDVITTGATLEACGQHLIAAGCAQLSVAVIAEAQ
jgi:ComF family protein